jgi:hypothetical protein
MSMVSKSAFVNGAVTGAVVVTVMALGLGAAGWAYLAWLLGTSLVAGTAWHLRAVRRAAYAHQRAYQAAWARRSRQGSDLPVG